MSIKVDENDPVGELEPSFSYRDVTIRRNVDMKEFYDLDGEIGRGKFGTVYRCREKSSGLTLAAKFVGIGRREDRRNVEREVQIMRMLQHPRIIQLYDACEAANVMCVIQELIEGGELFDRVIGDDFILTEKSCTVFVRQICEGVAFIHSKNVLHLDLKPENILCLTRTGNRIKIIDFGLARQYDPSKKLQVLFGTPEFVAPEVVNFDAISFGTDMWSVGVICYVLLSGLSPFMGETDVETMANVTIAQYDFDDEAFDDISEDAKDFIRKLLAKDISCRYTAAECLNHPWLLRRPLPVPGLDTAKDNLRDTVERWGEREPTPPTRVILQPEVILRTDTTTKLDETAAQRNTKPEPSVELQRVTKPEPSTEPQRATKPEPSAELQCVTKPEPSTEPQRATKPEPSTEPQRATKPEPSTEPQRATKPEPSTEPQCATKPEPSTEPQRATKPEPSTEQQHTTKPEPSTEPQHATEPDPSSAPKSGITLESATTPKKPSPQTSKNTSSEKEINTAVTQTKTQEEDSCKITKTPGDLPSPKFTKQTKAEMATVKDKEIKDTGPEMKVSTLTWPKKRPSITSQTSLPEGKPSQKRDIKSNMDDKFSYKFPLKPSGSFANNGNMFNSRIQQGNTEITISKKSLNPSPQPKIAGIVLGQTHPRESDSSLQKKDLFKQRSESTETKPKVITHKIIVEGKDVTENPVSEKPKGLSSVSQPINIENHQPLKHPLLKTLQNDRFERRCSDISCFMHEMESSNDGASIISEIKKLSSRLFESDLLDSSNNNSTSNLLRQIANRGVAPRRPKFRITNLNRDVPIGSPPPPTNMTYFMPPNLLSPDSYSSQTHSAPQSPRGSPERMSQTLDKDVILRLFNKLEEHSDSTVTKNYVINDSQKKFSSVSSK